MLQMALGVFGLTLDQFWRLTLYQWNCLVQGWERKRDWERHQRATEVCALVYGYRDKKPNMRKIANMVAPKTKEFDRDRFKDMIAESKARVAKQKAAAARAAEVE